MKHFFLFGGVALLSMSTLTGCIDNEYDLSDIDTTTEIKVNDLTLPVNFSPITLGDIIEIKDGSELKEVTINGQTFYAVNKTGDFKSNDIHIPGFSAPAPSVNPSTIHFQNPVNGVPNAAPASILKEYAFPEVHYPIEGQPPVSTHLNYEANNVDKSIVEVNDIYTKPFSIGITFSAPELKDIVDIELGNVIITMPKGLHFTSMNPSDLTYSDGVLTIPSLKFLNGEVKLNLTVDAVNDLVSNGYVIDAQRNFSINETITIEKATLKLVLKDIKDIAILPPSLDINVDYSFSSFEAESIMGTICYDVDGINISPVELNDIPDFLAQKGTNLILANPQIYLSLNNPVGEYGLSYRSGINITPVRNKVDGTPLTLGGDGFFNVSATTGKENILLCPDKKSANIPDMFSNPTYFPFQDLSYAISGDGIPDLLKIDLVNPQIPTQKLSKPFLLNSDLKGVEGEWQFLAPIALKNGNGMTSQIIYTDRADGWSSEDVDAITITKMKVTMTVDSDLSLSAKLSGTPLGKNGQPIPGVKVSEVTIPGNAHDYEVTITLEEGVVTNLDGFEFTATVTSASEEALNPGQTISIKKLRATVSGHYTKEF